MRGPAVALGSISKKEQPNPKARALAELALLKELKDAGIWLIDACVTALYQPGGAKLATGRPYGEVLGACWEAHVGHLVASCSPSAVLIVGKGVDRAIGSLVRQAAEDAEVVVVVQPNAHLDTDTRLLHRHTVFELCERHRLGAAKLPRSRDVGRPPTPGGVGEQYAGRIDVANIIEPAILINIAQEYTPGLTPEQLYERTRRYWVCSPERHKPELALAVARGIIREAYRIGRWERHPARKMIYPDADRLKNKPFVPKTTRVGFCGDVSPAHAHYKGLSVAHLQSKGFQSKGFRNPIMYLNC